MKCPECSNQIFVGMLKCARCGYQLTNQPSRIRDTQPKAVPKLEGVGDAMGMAKQKQVETRETKTRRTDSDRPCASPAQPPSERAAVAPPATAEPRKTLSQALQAVVMTPAAAFKQWQAERTERRIESLTAQAVDLSEGQQYDLLFLHVSGFVRATAGGQSITRIYADVENLIRKELRVVIRPGTYFVSSGGHQNMATTSEYTFTLHPCGSEHLGIDAVCINANRRIPGKNDRFVGVARVSDDVAKFLGSSSGRDAMVIQAGVWTLTDGYSRDHVINHLISRDSQGNTWHPVRAR